MKQVRGALSGKIAVPARLMPELVVMSMSHNGWSGTFNQLNEIVARKRKNTKAAGIGYEVDYAARIWWESLSETVTKVVVEVTDREGNVLERDCKQECANLIAGVDNRSGDLAQAITNQPRRQTYGNARWATSEDLGNGGRLTGEIDSSRLLLGVHSEKKYLALTPSDTVRHAIVCGPTGCGKTSTLFIPNLLYRTQASAIVTEATAGTISEGYQAEERAGNDGPDLFLKTAGYRQKKGHKIYYFNPDDMRSHRLNPVQGITTIRQATRLTNIIRTNTKLRESHGDQFWEDAESNLLSSLIMYAAGRKGDLAMVRQLLRGGPEKLTAMMEASNVAEARARFKDFLQWGTDNTRTSIVIGLIQRLELWTQPRVVALTQATDIDFDKLRSELFTFYLAVPSGVPELKPLAAIMLSYLVNFVCANEFEHPISLYLDEFTNFGYLPDFLDKMSIIRHRNLPAVLGLQDYAQAEERYGSAASLYFSQSNTRIFFKPNSLAQAKIISESLGVENVYERTVSGNCEITEREFGRDLMTPGAVQAMERGKAIAFLPDGPPVLLERFKPQDFDDMTAEPPPQLRWLEVDDRLVRDCEESMKPAPVEAAYQESKGDAGSEAKMTSSREAPEKSQLETKEKKAKQFNEYGDRIPSV